MRIVSYAMRGLAMMTLCSLILASDAKLGESQRTLDPEDANAKENNSLQKNAKLDRHLKIKKYDEVPFVITVKITDDSDHFLRLLPNFLQMDLEDYFFDQYGEKIKATFIEDTTDRNLIGDEEDPNSERELARYSRRRFRGMARCGNTSGGRCAAFKPLRKSAWNRDRGRELKEDLGEVLENFGADLTHVFTGIESIDVDL
eukprot:scaffold78126_cov51-Attheya_sp.AAC.1